jgi:hypothetical protein
LTQIPNLEQWRNDARLQQRGLSSVTSPNFVAAVRDLHLTPQEQHLYQHHLANLTAGGVWNRDGSVSTLLETTFNVNGRVYLIPTVWNNVIVDPDVGMRMAQREGLQNYPSYGSEQEAEQRYSQMHVYMARDLGTMFGP